MFVKRYSILNFLGAMDVPNWDESHLESFCFK